MSERSEFFFQKKKYPHPPIDVQYRDRKVELAFTYTGAPTTPQARPHNRQAAKKRATPNPSGSLNPSSRTLTRDDF